MREEVGWILFASHNTRMAQVFNVYLKETYLRLNCSTVELGIR